MKYSQNEKINQVNEETLVVGIDVGGKEHYARAFDWRGIELSKVFCFSNTREGFERFLNWIEMLKTKNDKAKTMVGLEPTGHYWFNLGEYLEPCNIAIAMVNPYHVKQTKELDDNSQTKHDRKDPKTIAKLVIEGRYSFPYIPKGIYAELRVCNNCREKLVQEITRARNMLSRWFAIYFPEHEKVYCKVDAVSSMILLRYAATPEELVGLGAEGINKIWRDAKVTAVGMNKAKKLVEAAKESIGCTEGTQAAKFQLKLILDDYEQKMKQYEEVMQIIQELSRQIPQIEKMLQIKGIGLVTAAGFVAEIGDIRRFESPRQIQKLAGLSLKENSSGKHKGQTSISKRGRSRLRLLLFKGAIPLVAQNPEFKEIHKYYITRRDNPLKKIQSIIAICCKLIRVFYAILTKGVEYDGQQMKRDIHRPEIALVA